MVKKAQPLLMPRADLEFYLQLKRRSGLVLHAQLADQLRDAICLGQLKAGSRIPSSRQLAKLLGVNRNVVVIAFETLLSEGYLFAQHGSGTFVTKQHFETQKTTSPTSKTHRWAKTQEAKKPLPTSVISFALGKPSVTELETSAWRSIWRKVGNTSPIGNYPDPQGHFELREAIAKYLGRSRGLHCVAEDVIITSGSSSGLQLIARAALKPHECVAIEEPGYRLAHNVFSQLNVPIKAIPVDKDGLMVDCLPTSGILPVLVYCTPAHQYPLGTRLSLPRRLALLDWARVHDCLILEDDYDSEFRYETTPLPALAGLGQDCTVYMGTFSKTIAPSLRVSYLIAPKALHVEIMSVKRENDFDTSLPLQIAIAEFIASGDYERHIRRMRRVYAEKRRVLLRSLEPILDIVIPIGIEAGLHIYLELPKNLKADLIVQQALNMGIGVSSIQPYFLEPPTTNGLLLGYGGLSTHEIQMGMEKLVHTMLELAT